MDNQSKSKQPQRIGNHKDVFFADFSFLPAHLGTLQAENRIKILPFMKTPLTIALAN